MLIVVTLVLKVGVEVFSENGSDLEIILIVIKHHVRYLHFSYNFILLLLILIWSEMGYFLISVQMQTIMSHKN